MTVAEVLRTLPTVRPRRPSLSRLAGLWRAYRRCAPGARLRVLERYLLCPFDVITPYVPTGQVLDVGCGDGLLLHLLADDPCRQLVGIDVDRRKIASAARVVGATRVADIKEVASEQFDCVTVIDVLYLLPLEDWPSFLSHCVRVLKRGGLLIVKEVANTPRWKAIIGHFAEVIAIQGIKITRGGRPHLEPIKTYRDALVAADTVVLRIHEVGQGRPHGHVLLVAWKPAGGPPKSLLPATNLLTVLFDFAEQLVPAASLGI